MDIPLSNNDILRLLGGRTRVIHYEELAGFSSIESLLSPYGSAVILYPSVGNVGHWTCVLYTVDDRGKKIIEFFDPYGLSVDKEFSYTDPSERNPRYMCHLLANSKYDIEFNDHRFQHMTRDVSTCGRHVVNRIWNASMPLSVYSDLYGDDPQVSSDEIVTALTDR